MDDKFWNIFRETGEPMCYLLSKADMGLYDMPGEKRFANDAASKTETAKRNAQQHGHSRFSSDD